MNIILQILSTVANIANIIGLIWMVFAGSRTMQDFIKRNRAKQQTGKITIDKPDFNLNEHADVDDRILLSKESTSTDEHTQLNLSEQPSGTTSEEQTLQLYQKTLCDIFNFSSSDLACNRQGLISQWQYERLRKEAIVSFWVFVFFLLFCSVLIFFVQPGWRWGVGIGAIDVLLIAFGLIWLADKISSYDTNRHKVRVDSEVGKINVHEEFQVAGDIHGTVGSVRHYSVNGIRLPGPSTSSQSFSPINHRVYYLAGSEKEFMSIEPCVDCSDGRPQPLFGVVPGEETLRQVLSPEAKARLRHLMPGLDEEA